MRLYEKYIASVLTLGAVKSEGKAKAAAKVITNLEMKLADYMLKARKTTPIYHSMTYSKASEMYPLSIGTTLSALKLNTNGSDKIRFTHFTFFNGLEKLLKGQSLEDLKTFLEFQLLHTYATVLTPALAKANWEFFGNHLRGEEAEPTREARCIKATDLFMGDLIDEHYVKAIFVEKSSYDLADKMVVALKESFKQGINAATWLDDKTREEGLSKLSKLKHLMGAPANLKTYTTLTLDSKDYLGNRDRVAVFNTNANLGLIGTTVDRYKWDMRTSDIDAAYFRKANCIVLSAANFQSPFFNVTATSAQNFGAIGWTIGHEITHGFDNAGRWYDGDGKVKTWWSKASSTKFEEKAECFVDQYNAFEVKSEVSPNKSLGKVDGQRTLGEVIADNGGLKSAYRAYHNYLQTHPSELSDKTGSKVFFLSFAQSECSKNKDQRLLVELKDTHPPSQVRVNGAVQNNDKFAETFECLKGTKMNPAKMCNLWE